MSDRELLEGIYWMLLVALRDINDDARQFNINLTADTLNTLIELIAQGKK